MLSVIMPVIDKISKSPSCFTPLAAKQEKKYYTLPEVRMLMHLKKIADKCELE